MPSINSCCEMPSSLLVSMSWKIFFSDPCRSESDSATRMRSMASSTLVLSLRTVPYTHTRARACVQAFTRTDARMPRCTGVQLASMGMRKREEHGCGGRRSGARECRANTALASACTQGRPGAWRRGKRQHKRTHLDHRAPDKIDKLKVELRGLNLFHCKHLQSHGFTQQLDACSRDKASMASGTHTLSRPDTRERRSAPAIFSRAALPLVGWALVPYSTTVN